MPLPAEAELEKLLRREEFEGVFFLHGDAARLRDAGARRLMDAAVDPATRDFNLDRFRGREREPEEIASAMAMPPMMADRRVVAIFDAQDLTPTGRKVVLEALEAPPPGLTLIVVASIPDRSKASFYKTLKRKARTLEWSVPREEELPGWLMQRAASRLEVELSPRAARMIVSAVGADLDLLQAELEKLAGATEGEEITAESVRKLVPNVREVDRWEWLDLVADREYLPALRSLPTLLGQSSESAVGLLIGMIDQHLFISIAVERGKSGVEKALVSAGKPYLKWKARIYARQARGWSAGELERALGLMRKADWSVKTGAGDRRALEELLLSLHLLRMKAA